MKILYVYNEMPGVYQRYLNSLLEKVKESLKVESFSYDYNEFSDTRVNRYYWSGYYQRLLFKLRLSDVPSLDLKTMQKFDIVHIQHSFLWQRVQPLLELKNRPKVVITLRGGDTYLKPWTFRRMEEFYRNKSHLIDAFVVMSQHQKDYLQRWGVEEKKIHVIPISFGLKSKALPKRPNPDVLRLVSAFRMTWEKNIEGHIQFAKLLKDKNIPFKYDIYGGGHDIDQLYYLVDRYDLQDYISVKGKVENQELLEVMPNYDFYLQLSITESLGMSVIEAQSKGVPCVISNSDGLPEVVKAGASILAPYNELNYLVDEMLELWADKHRYFEFSEQGISFVNSKFNIETETSNLENLYKNL